MGKEQKYFYRKNGAQSMPADKESGALSLPGHLQKVFGFPSFRLNQESIVREIMRGRDVFAVMPTGGGKSLCYQLPAHMLKGVCVVISPLISLMKDQVDAARETGLRAAFLNSSLTAREMAQVYRDLKVGLIDLLYVSPERFVMEDFLATLASVPLCLFAIDEAHCISEWGHDFRPDYLSLAIIAERFTSVPVAAFTATATQRVQDDTIARLHMRSPFIVRASFNRPNLFYQVLAKQNPDDQVLAFVRERPGEAGIVYRTTRASVETTAAHLKAAGIKALAYHAGLDAHTRTIHQEAFNRDEARVMVATIAFGMGIDKSNTRFIIHADLPKNMEGYYQETGRAGRDGEPAHCLLLYGRGDIAKIRYFIDQMADEKQRRAALDNLTAMADYAGFNICRRRQVLAYFGERYEQDNCGACDICSDHVERIDATREAQMIMSAMARTKERFGAGHIISLVRGERTKKIAELEHDILKTFGVGKDRDASFWHAIIDELTMRECIVRTDDHFPVLRILPKGREILRAEKNFTVLKRETTVKRRKLASFEAYNEKLFERLQELRKRIADERGVPAFVVFSDSTLHDMCRRFPTTEGGMLEVTGVGEQKLRLYGPRFMAVVERFLTDNPQCAPVHRVAPPSRQGGATARKGATLETTLELARQGVHYSEIAARRGLTATTVAGHLEKLLRKKYALEIDPQVPKAKRQAITQAFKKSGSLSLAPIMAELEDRVSYEEARIVRGYLEGKGEL
jgi:ATP-dependent DNA helicase RecQ